MTILVTGANGFIGANLIAKLREDGRDYVPFTRGMSSGTLAHAVEKATFVFHLAGENRPKDNKGFARGNTALTRELCDAIRATGRAIPVVFASSTQAELDNPYGASKLEAEKSLAALASDTDTPALIYRLPGLFGKWSRPNYNSVVATFCHNIANDQPLRIDDPDAMLTLAYVDDVVAEFTGKLGHRVPGLRKCDVSPTYRISVGALADAIKALKASRETLITENVGDGLLRALNATYLSFLRPAQFSYSLPQYTDPRGTFVEMLKTKQAGQLSFFTARPGVTRGSHYHHSKTEKFLVVRGTARFGFRHLLTGEKFELITKAAEPVVVETIPGWAHDITNIGDDEMIAMLWASEIFDRGRPDTIAQRV